VTLQTRAPINFRSCYGSQAEGLACADPVARTTISVSGNFKLNLLKLTINSQERGITITILPEGVVLGF
jgi:hypothetical protein